MSLGKEEGHERFKVAFDNTFPGGIVIGHWRGFCHEADYSGKTRRRKTGTGYSFVIKGIYTFFDLAKFTS